MPQSKPNQVNNFFLLDYYSKSPQIHFTPKMNLKL